LSKRWFKVWPHHIPRELSYHVKPAYSILEDAVERASDSPALIDEVGSVKSFKELEEESSLFADALASSGVAENDKVAFMSTNEIEAIEALYGILKSGATAVIIDPTTMSEDLKFQLEDSQAKALVIDLDSYTRERDTIEKVGIRNIAVIGLESGALAYKQFKKRGTNRDFRADIDPLKSAAIIFYYAGIAGRTEQVIHSHYGVYTCALSASVMKSVPEETHRISLLASPMTHVLGLINLLSTHAAAGSVVVMRRFDPATVYRLIQQHGITHITAAPMAFDALLKLDQVSKDAVASLRFCSSGGAPLSQDTQRRFREVFGVPLVQEYGLTEALLVTIQPYTVADIAGTVGIPMVGVDAKIVKETGEEAEPGEVGELVIRSPWIMLRYADDEDTRRAIRNGWLYTGDLMMMDDSGLLYFRGVKKRMIKYKAYPVFPRDLELLLMKHEAVKEAIVVGVPDPETGQKPVAYVVLKDEYKNRVNVEEIISFVNSRVAAYKKIREIRVVEQLPKE